MIILTLIKWIAIILLVIIGLILLAFLFCVIKAFYITNIAKKEPYKYKKVNMRSKK